MNIVLEYKQIRKKYNQLWLDVCSPQIYSRTFEIYAP